MEKTKSFLIGSIYTVLRFLALGFLAGIMFWLCLFEVDFNFKNYDLVFTSRLNSSIYYGIEYTKKIEVWKSEGFDDGSFYSRRIYP